MLQEFANIRSKLQSVTQTGSGFTGTLTIDDYDIAALKNLHSGGLAEDEFQVNSHTCFLDDLVAGQTALITLISPANYYEDEAAFLNIFSEELPTGDYYIHSLKFASSEAIKPAFIQKYESVIKLIDFLTRLSDYQKGTMPKELVFAKQKLAVITLSYTSNDVTAFQGNGKVDELINHLSTSADSKERVIIFLNELAAFVLKIPEVNERFATLLDKYCDVFDTYLKSHDLYLAQYSYQKNKSEIDDKILDYSKKIQSVVNDAQAKLVSVPIATFLGLSQIDLSGSKAFINLVVMVSSIFFSLLLQLFINNQFSTLEFVNADIKKFREDYDEEKASALGGKFSDLFIKLAAQDKTQKNYLRLIAVIIWLPTLAAVALNIYASFWDLPFIS